MLLVVSAVAGLFYLGRTARPRGRADRPPPPAPPAAVAGEAQRQPSPRDAVVVTEGFEYEQQVEGKPVFRIRGDRMTTDRGGKVELEGVGLELYRSGEPFTMRSKRAVYDRATGEAQLVGDVELEAHAWRVMSERFDLIDGGKTVVSGRGEDRVRFRRTDEIAGNAQALRFTIDDERLELTGGVQASGREEGEGKRMSIEAQRLTWERDSRAIQGEGEVHLAWGRSQLRADRLDAVLRVDESGVESAEATGKVQGELVPEKGNRIELAGDYCRTLFDSAGDAPSVVVLRGDRDENAARVDWRNEGSRRWIVSPRIELRLADGTPTSASASNGAQLEEEFRGTKRRVKGRSLEAAFDAEGALASADLEGGVELSDGELTASGTVAKLIEGGERATLDGKPARATSPRGELIAPKIVYRRSTGEMSASGGVRARFEPEQSPLPASGEGGASREPVHVEAKSGTFLQASRGFRFEGQVQAVQGTSLLFADRLEGDEKSGTTTASGNVRTIWRDAPAGDAKPAKGAPKPPETIATSESLTYRRDEGFLRYAGDVDVRQAPREIKASEVVVHLSEDRRAERLHAKGAVVLRDGSTGQTVKGDEAEYDLSAKSAVVTGELVAIQDREGNVLKGKRALFDLVTGSAKLVSGES